MRNIKVYKTREMPNEQWEYLRDSQLVEINGFAGYVVSAFVDEAIAEPSEDYDQDDVEKAKRFDDWLVANGARKGETILIEHG